MNLENDQKRTATLVGLLALVGLLLYLLSPILTPFVSAVILAYVLNPGVDWLVKKRLPRWLSVLLMLLLFVGASLLIALLLIPVLQKELPALQQQIPIFLARLNDWLAPKLKTFGVSAQLDLEGIKSILSDQIAASPEALFASLFAKLKAGGTVALAALANTLLIPMLAFYLLLDWHRVVHMLRELIPRRNVAHSLRMARSVDELLSQYLRGQILIMLILAGYYSIALLIAGFEVAAPVGIFTGLLVFIPYVGYGIGLCLAIIAALLQFGNLYGLIAVGVVYGFGQIIESFVLTPMLVGERIGLHPLAVIFALLAFGQLFGFVGILLALPVSAILLVVLRELKTFYLSSSFYKD